MGKKRTAGEGTIVEVPGGFRGAVTIGYDARGRRKRKWFSGKTAAAVRDQMSRYKVNLLDGTTSDTKGQSVGAFVTEWLENGARLKVKPSTYISYEVIVRRHIVPRVGRIKLDKFAPTHVQAFQAGMERDGMSARNRQYAHTLLSSALKTAVKWGRIPRNPCDLVDRPRAPRKEFQVLDAHQAKALMLAARSDRFHAMYLLAISTGMRQGELLGLQWADIDFKRGHLSVRRTLVDLKGKLVVGTPKSKSAVRRIELPDFVKVALLKHKERMFAEGHAAAWVFCDTHGGPMRKSNLHRRSYKPLLAAVGLPDIRFHDLRHSAATLLLADNVPIKVVQELLGHAHVSITLGIYAHVTPSMQATARLAMDALFAEAPGDADQPGEVRSL